MPRGGHGGHGGHGGWGRHTGWGTGGWGRRRYGYYGGGFPVAVGYPGYYAGYTYPYYAPIYDWGSPVGTAYGSCDCGISGNYVQANNCNGGIPLCAGGNCTCYNSASGTSGCHNTRGAIC